MISGYTRESGVRQLEREIGRLVRKAARKIASGEAAGLKIDGDDVRDLLGRPKVRPERAAAEDQVGVATGMYYTPVGGDIMFVGGMASIRAERVITSYSIHYTKLYDSTNMREPGVRQAFSLMVTMSVSARLPAFV